MNGDVVREELPGTVPALLAYARMLAGNEQDARDLVQDTLVRALESADRFDGRSSLVTWLRRILHNRWIDVVRARREDPRDDIAEVVEGAWRDDDYTVDTAQVVIRAETRDDLLDALAHMPAIYRTAVVLHDAHGLTGVEVAEATGTSLPTAKQRIRRGRMMLVSSLAATPSVAARRGVPMRCWQARARVSDYLDGDLDEPGARELEAHLAGCATCPPLYAALVGTRAAVARAGTPDPDSVVPEGLATRITALLG